MVIQHSATQFIHRYGNFIYSVCAWSGKSPRGLGSNISHPIISPCFSKFPPFFAGTKSARYCTIRCLPFSLKLSFFKRASFFFDEGWQPQKSALNKKMGVGMNLQEPTWAMVNTFALQPGVNLRSNTIFDI